MAPAVATIQPKIDFGAKHSTSSSFSTTITTSTVPYSCFHLDSRQTLAHCLDIRFANCCFLFRYLFPPELSGASGIGRSTRPAPVNYGRKPWTLRVRKGGCGIIGSSESVTDICHSHHFHSFSSPPSMFQRLRLSHILLTLFLLTSFTSAWPWPPSYKDIAGLILRRQDDSKSGKSFGGLCKWGNRIGD